MSTPISGTICWSQIQSVTGGSYCMSNFNSTSGRGTCASNYYNYNPAPTVNLSWSNTVTAGANGCFDIYVNGVIEASGCGSTAGNIMVHPEDVVYAVLSGYGCGGATNTNNLWTDGIIVDAICGIGSSSMTTYTHTVTAPVGTTINLYMYSDCEFDCR